MIIKEELVCSDYEVYNTFVSEIDTSKTKEVCKSVDCPHCKTEIPHKFIHGVTLVCSFCGLRMTPYGNRLDCELEK